MATITITDLPPAVHERLRAAAQRHGRTPEAEARAALESCYSPISKAPDQPPADLDEIRRRVRRAQELAAPYRREGLVDEFLRERRRMWGEE